MLAVAWMGNMQFNPLLQETRESPCVREGGLVVPGSNSRGEATS